MAEGFLRDHPGLRPFVLSDVQLTGTMIGGGAYGRVDEVAFPVVAAAETVYAFLHGTVGDLPKAAREFVRECQLMSTLRHPNIVQFLGVTFFPGSRLPAVVMERLPTSLHDLLDPDPDRPPPRDAVPPLAFFSMALKCSVLQDVARGLAYLHGQSPPIIHRDLSARNILLHSGMVGKIADLGVARIAPRMRAAATMARGPGALIYMPPEVFEEKAKCDTSIDIFSLGVVTIFTVGETFPCDPLAPNYVDESSGLLVARTELQRRSEYMTHVNIKLRACGQLHADQPFIRLIQQCLQNLPAKRPVIHEVQHLLEEARTCFGDRESERNRREPVQALHTQPRNQVRAVHSFIRCELMCDLQNLECVLRDLVTENADLRSRNQTKDRELAKAQQQLREKVSFFYLYRHWKSTVLFYLQETQVTNVTQQLREKVSVLELLSFQNMF